MRHSRAFIEFVARAWKRHRSSFIHWQKAELKRLRNVEKREHTAKRAGCIMYVLLLPKIDFQSLYRFDCFTRAV